MYVLEPVADNRQIPVQSGVPVQSMIYMNAEPEGNHYGQPIYGQPTNNYPGQPMFSNPGMQVNYKQT